MSHYNRKLYDIETNELSIKSTQNHTLDTCGRKLYFFFSECFINKNVKVQHLYSATLNQYII